MFITVALVHTLLFAKNQDRLTACGNYAIVQASQWACRNLPVRPASGARQSRLHSRVNPEMQERGFCAAHENAPVALYWRRARTPVRVPRVREFRPVRKRWTR
jgi:hypothetical protein